MHVSLLFYNKLVRVVNKHTPLKIISKRKAKQLSKPWITRGTRISIRKKNELYYSDDIAKYKLYRNILSRLSKKLYYHNFFQTNMSNIKNTWKEINLLVNGKTRGDNVITALKRPGNGGLSHKADETPNIVNSFFTSISPNLAARIPQAQKHFSSFLPKQKNAGSFVFKPAIPIEIEAEILSIPLNKVYGLYFCPARILKCASKIISSPLCKLINNSIEIGAYPSKLKYAKVVPVYKGEDKTDSSNYRSPLSVFNRIFEKSMNHRLMAFLEINGFLCDSQYGFREKHSTEHTLIDIVNQVQPHFDKGILSCGVFIDLKKLRIRLTIAFYYKKTVSLRH